MKKEIINSKTLKDDIRHLCASLTLSSEEAAWFAKVYMREVLRGEHFQEVSRAEGVQQVSYTPSDQLKAQARYILDWLAELSLRDPVLHSKLPRITFAQAYQHSDKWHKAMAKASEKDRRHIEPDEENAPMVLDLGDGWEVFWLKTDLARDIEGKVMGHCIGSGGYDKLYPGEEVFSIRKENVTHITMHLDGSHLKQAVTKGNGSVPERYQWLVDETVAILGTRLFLEHAPDERIEDGKYELPDRQTIAWVEGEKFHKNDGPALEEMGDLFWFQNGKRHREDGPAVEYMDGTKYWFWHGQLHREDGPAIIYPETRAGERREVWALDGKWMTPEQVREVVRQQTDERTAEHRRETSVMRM